MKVGGFESRRPSRFAARELRIALETTFAFRATHGLPTEVPAPPAWWSAPYVALAEENGLPWASLAVAHEAVVAFLRPVLAGEGGQWDPVNAMWGPEG